MTDNDNSVETKTLAETDHFVVWKAEEPGGESTYHVELSTATLHFFEEEWEEFTELMRSV